MGTNGIFVTVPSTIFCLTFNVKGVPFFERPAGTYPMATLTPKEGEGQPEVMRPTSCPSCKMGVPSRAGGPRLTIPTLFREGLSLICCKMNLDPGKSAAWRLLLPMVKALVSAVQYV